MNDDRFAPGLYVTDAEATSVAGDWRLAGWTPKVVRLPDDLEPDAARGTLVALGEVLGLGSRYAATWDALDDGLRGVPANTVLVWASGAAFADEHADVWARLGDAFAERVRRTPPFAVVLADAPRRPASG